LSELRSVLLVEDEYFLAADLEEALTDAGFATDVVSSGEEALTLFAGGGDDQLQGVGYRYSSARQRERVGGCKADQRKRPGLPRRLRD